MMSSCIVTTADGGAGAVTTQATVAKTAVASTPFAETQRTGRDVVYSRFPMHGRIGRWCANNCMD